MGQAGLAGREQHCADLPPSGVRLQAVVQVRRNRIAGPMRRPMLCHQAPNLVRQATAQIDDILRLGWFAVADR